MGFSEKSISKQSDYPSNGVKITNDLCPMGKHVNWIEYSSEIGKWREKESRHNRYLIKCLGKEGINKSKSAKKIGKKGNGNQNNDWMDDKISTKKQWYDPCDKSDNKTTDHSSNNMTEKQGGWMSWRYEKLLYGPGEFTAKERTYDIRIGIRNHSHSNKSRHEKCCIGNTSWDSNICSNNSSKYDKVEGLIEYWWDQGLSPYSKYSIHLTTNNRHEDNKLGVHRWNYQRCEKSDSSRFFSGRIPLTWHSWISRTRSACMRENFWSIVTR